MLTLLFLAALASQASANQEPVFHLEADSYYLQQLHARQQYVGNVQCTNLPPGLEKQRLGIDVRKFDPAPWFDPGTANDTDPILGYKNTLFDFTCDQNLTFIDLLSNNTQYQMPDQMALIYFATHGYLDTEYSNYASTEIYRQETSQNLGVDGTYKKFTAGGSVTYKKAHEEETTHNRTMTTVFADVSGMVGQLQPGWFVGVGRAAQYLLNVLPDNYEDNPTAYCLFVDTFGTHYLDQVILGGVFRTVSLVDSVYKEATDSSSLEWDAKAAYDKDVSIHGGHTRNDSHTSKNFDEHSSTTSQFYGGLKDLMNDTKFDEWWASVQTLPSIISAQLKPIPNIIALSAPKKASSLQKAQLLYVGDGCIPHLRKRRLVKELARIRRLDPILYRMNNFSQASCLQTAVL